MIGIKLYRKKGNDREKDTVLIEKKRRGKVTGQREKEREWDSPEKWGDRKLFMCRKGGQAIFKCLRLLICQAAKPLYTVANVKLVLGTSRSPWPPACLRLEYKCGVRRWYSEKTVSTPCTQEFKKAERRIPSGFTQTKDCLGPHICLCGFRSSGFLFGLSTA